MYTTAQPGRSKWSSRGRRSFICDQQNCGQTVFLARIPSPVDWRPGVLYRGCETEVPQSAERVAGYGPAGRCSRSLGGRISFAGALENKRAKSKRVTRQTAPPITYPAPGT